MKKILILFLGFLPFVVSAQFVNDTMPNLPYSEVDYNDFAVTNSFSNFNGGVQTFTPASSFLSVATTGSAQGVIANFVHKASTEYMLEIYIVDPAAGLTVYSNWSNAVGTVSTAGWYRFKFTTSASGGGFGHSVVIASNTATAGTFKIGFYRLSEKNAFRDIPYMSEVASIADTSISRSAFYINDFNENDNGISYTYTPPTTRVANGSLMIAPTSNANGLIVKNTLFPDTCVIDAWIDATITNTALEVRGNYSTSVNKTGSQYITTSGLHKLTFAKKGDFTNNYLDGLAIFPVAAGGGTIQINSIKIQLREENIDKYDPIVQLGKGTSMNYSPTGAESIEFPVIIGNGALAKDAAVVIGDSAKGGGFPYFGASQSNGEITAVGLHTFAGGWRTTAVGAESAAFGQSSTAIGSGAEALTTHSISLGRGSFVGRYPHNSATNETNNTAAFESKALYLANGWASVLPSPINSDQTRIEPNTILETEIHGGDAFDARYPQYTGGTTYKANDIVYDGGFLYASKVNSNTGNTPLTSLTQWTQLMAEPKGAQATNSENGRNLGIYAGRATNTGISGKVSIYVAEGTNGSNVKDTPKAALEVRSEEGITAGKTHLWVYDTTTSTMKQVSIKKPTSGTKGVVGFNRLQIN